MNQLNGKNNNVHVTNQPHIKSTQLDTMPSLENNNNILSENDEYCYELDQSSYSNISKSKSLQSNSNAIQNISQLSDLNIENNEHPELPLKYINHLPVNKKNNVKNNNIKINSYKKNLESKK